MNIKVKRIRRKLFAQMFFYIASLMMLMMMIVVVVVVPLHKSKAHQKAFNNFVIIFKFFRVRDGEIEREKDE